MTEGEEASKGIPEHLEKTLQADQTTPIHDVDDALGKTAEKLAEALKRQKGKKVIMAIPRESDEEFAKKVQDFENQQTTEES